MSLTPDFVDPPPLPDRDAGGGSAEPLRCRCGAGSHAEHAGRCAAGHQLSGAGSIGPATVFPPGNFHAIQHALRSDRLPPEFGHLAAELEEFIRGCLLDEGDEAELSTRRRSLLNYRARIHRRILQLDTALELQGLFDRRGKLRLMWLQRLEGLIAAAKGLDSLLGLDRKPRRVPLSPSEALMQQPRAHQKGWDE
jgi:hypothetical protein